MTRRYEPPVAGARALLCDRDGTLVVDVPYNADPDRVESLPGVAAALDRARAAGIRVAVISNQRGVALGLISPAALAAVNLRVSELLGPFDAVECCPHDVSDRCRCRKPAPGLVLRAAAHLGLPPSACVVVGDSWRDVVAARNAGAAAVLVGDGAARPAGEDVVVCPDVGAAVDLVLGDRSLV